MNDTKFAFFGATSFSEELLKFLIEYGLLPKVIFTIPEEFNISYADKKVVNSNFTDLRSIAEEYDIPLLEVDSVEGKRISDYEEVIESFDLDLLLILGWYYMVPKKIRDLARLGAWGIHASLLPRYAGGAPLNWAMINGEKKTGVTLFRMDDGVDDGDIIDQLAFDIESDDYISDVYQKATKASISILNNAMKNVDNVTFTQQDKSKIELYPQRRPEDGELSLMEPAEDIYNAIRAQASPYPGAFIRTVDGKKIIIERARVED